MSRAAAFLLDIAPNLLALPLAFLLCEWMDRVNPWRRRRRGWRP